MPKLDLDAIITTLLQTAEGVSDLLFVVGRPPQIEVYGKLRPVERRTANPILTPEETEQIAVTLIGGNERLYHDFMNSAPATPAMPCPASPAFASISSGRTAITPSSCAS